MDRSHEGSRKDVLGDRSEVGMKGARESWRGGVALRVWTVEGREGKSGAKRGRERKCYVERLR